MFHDNDTFFFDLLQRNKAECQKHKIHPTGQFTVHTCEFGRGCVGMHTYVHTYEQESVDKEVLTKYAQGGPFRIIAR
jgi:hypothetical protein